MISSQRYHLWWIAAVQEATSARRRHAYTGIEAWRNRERQAGMGENDAWTSPPTERDHIEPRRQIDRTAEDPIVARRQADRVEMRAWRDKGWDPRAERRALLQARHQNLMVVRDELWEREQRRYLRR